MKAHMMLKIGYYKKNFGSTKVISKEAFVKKVFNKRFIHSWMLLNIDDYFVKNTKLFDGSYIYVTGQTNKILPNGTIEGLYGMINRSEIDIGITSFTMNENTTRTVDFSYPYLLEAATFITQKHEPKPDIFRISQTFSLSLWIAIFSVFTVMSIVYYASSKRKYALNNVFLNMLAVLLRQSAIIVPSKAAEHLLFYSWVIGSMFICLAYESVFLSVLVFPTSDQIKDVSQLAKAVSKGEYHCAMDLNSAFKDQFDISKEESLKIIENDLKTNNLDTEKVFRNFIFNNVHQNLAVIVSTNVVDVLNVGGKFISEDRFFESMPAMPMRKDFCCKRMMETFVHRMMASGLYFKYNNDRSFFIRLRPLLKYSGKETSKRNITLTDLVSAFVILISGHVLSFLVLIVEILVSLHKKRKYSINNKNKNQQRKSRALKIAH